MRLPLGGAISRRIAPARPSPTKLNNILNSDVSRAAPPVAPVRPGKTKLNNILNSDVSRAAPAKHPTPMIVSPSRASNMPFSGAPTRRATLLPQGQGYSVGGGVDPVASQIAQARNTLASQQAQSQQSGYNPSNADYYNRAYNSVDVQLTPQEQALQRQAALAEQMQRYQDAQSQANTQRTVNEQQDLYAKLNDQLNGQMPAIGGNYDAAGKQVGDVYNNLIDALSKQYGDANTATTNEVQRLGLDPALPTATGQINSDAAFLKGLAGSDSAVLQGTIGNEKATALKDALANIATQAAAGKAISAGTLRDALNTQHSSDFTNSQKIADLLGQSTSLEGTRKGLVGEAYSKLQDLAAQQAYQAQQDAITNKINQEKADAQFALSGADVNLKQAQADAARMDSMTKQQVANATIGKSEAEKQAILDKMTPGTVAYQKLQADIAAELSNASVNKQNANTNQYKATHSGSGSASKGIAGSMAYLSQAVDPDAATHLSQIVNHSANRYPPSGTKATNDVNFAKALSEARTIGEQQGLPQATLNALDAAIGIVYGH